MVPGRMQKGRRSEGLYPEGSKALGAPPGSEDIIWDSIIPPSSPGPADSQSMNAGGMEGIAWQLFGSCLAQCHVPGWRGLLLPLQMPPCCQSPRLLTSVFQEERVEMGASLA